MNKVKKRRESAAKKLQDFEKELKDLIEKNEVESAGIKKVLNDVEKKMKEKDC